MEARYRERGLHARRALIALSAAVIAATAVPAALAATDDSASRGGPMLPPNNVAESVAESSTETEQLDSRTAFQDASPSEAVAVAERAFPELIGLLGAPPLPNAAELVEYRGAFSAVLGHDAGPVVVESMTPLRVAGSPGLEPVSPTLERAGDEFVPEASPTDISLPSDLSDGIEFGARDLGVSLAGNQLPGEPRPLTGNRGLLYHEVASDLDLIAGVTASGGLELIAQVRSPESPEEVIFPLDLPSGAELRSGPDGGVSVVAGGEAIAAITPPLAFDADHNVVPVQMAVDGDSLVLSINHRDEEVRYPVVADPAIFEAWDWNNPGPEGLQYFESFKSGGTNHEFASVSDLSPYNGLWIKTHAGWYLENTHGAWSFRVPHSNAYAHAGPVDGAATSAYITQAWFSPYYHWGAIQGYPPDSDTSPLLAFCLANVLNDTCMSDSNGSGHASAFYQGQYNWSSGETLTNVADHQQAERVTVDHVSDTDVFPNSYLYGERWTQVAGFAVAMSDGESPTVSATTEFASGGALPSGWTDRTDNVTTTITGNDGGLGVRNLQVWLGCDANRQNCASTPAAFSGACIGGRTKVCPQNASQPHTYSLGSIPQGRSYGWVQGTDPLEKTSPDAQARWEFKIDRSAPQLAFSGSLWSHRTDYPTILPPGSHGLSVTATDGSSSSPSAERSGVKNITITVDGELAHATPDQGCATSCSLATSWTLDPTDRDLWTPGPHEIVVTATDQLGHQSSQTILVMLDPKQTPIAMCGGSANTSGDEYIDELEIAADPSIVTDIAEPLFGARYGGASIRRSSCPSMIEILVKNLQPADGASLSTALLADGRVDVSRVRAVAVPYSEAELDEGADTAAEILEEDGVAGSWGVRPDLDDQTIHIEAANVPLLTRLRIELLVDPPVAFDPAPGLVLFHGRDDGFDVEGGQEVSDDDCSVGFPVMRGNNEMWTTAGHCVIGIPYQQQVVCCGGIEAGHLEYSELREAQGDDRRMISDAALVNGSDEDIAERIIINDSGEHRSVVRELRERNYVDHRNVCYSGAQGDSGDGHSACGHIENRYKWWRDPDGRLHNRIYCALQHTAGSRPAHGDSGGPIYKKAGDGRAAAAGIFVAGADVEAAPPVFCFTPMYRVLNALNADRVATPNTPSIGD
jgi:hypothetical protein